MATQALVGSMINIRKRTRRTLDDITADRARILPRKSALVQEKHRLLGSIETQSYSFEKFGRENRSA
jgi:hypothetical protein